MTEPSPALTTAHRALIFEAIRGGLPNEKGRLDDAAQNREFFVGDFSRYSPRDADASRDKSRFVRTSLFMQRAVNTLTAMLYKDGPKRALKPPGGGEDADYEAAGAWLEGVYRRNNVNALLQKADRYSFVSDVAAIQAEACEDPDCPVKLRLWDASEFMVWCRPDDPTRAVAVAIRDMFDQQRRLRLYSADEVSEFRTAKWDMKNLNAATAYAYVGTIPNALGILPFAFFPFEIPTADFWTPGPGSHLRQANDWINGRLTAILDACRFGLDPMLVVKNARDDFRVPGGMKPGDAMYLQGLTGDITKDPVTPELAYLQPDPGHIEAGWLDLNFGVDHDLEMIGVPPSMIRMVQDSSRSGASIVAEQLEPVKHAEGRQGLAEVVEDDLAKLVLAVGAAHLGGPDNAGYPEYAATAAQLAKVAARPGLSLRWPSLYPKIPGTEADQGDQWRLDNGLASRVTVLMERMNMNREEAEAYLVEIAEDVKREHELFGAAELAKAQADGEKLKVMNAAQAESGGAPDPKPEPDPSEGE